MRWVKMTKYVSQFGWAPVVYTPSNGEVPVYDESLIEQIPTDLEVVKRRIWEPYRLYKTFTGRNKKEKQYSGFINEKGKTSLTQKISVFVRGNFFIPDARMFWIKPSVRFLIKYLEENPVDAIVSTGPPHSMHMIALKLHQATHLPWIADFRDPWTNIGFYPELRLTKWGDARHRAMERNVLLSATKVVAVTWRSRDEFKEICGRDDIAVIPNGFDDADFTHQKQQKLDEKFSIVYIGSLNKARNPHALWAAVSALIKESEEFRNKIEIKLVGPMDIFIRESIRVAGLEPYTIFIEFVPHNEAIRFEQKAQVLLLIMINSPNAKTVIPGKLFEYLGSGRPVLGICPKDSDSAKVIELTRGGVVHEEDDVHGLKSRLREFFELYKNASLIGNAEGLEKFTRKSLAGDYAKLLNEVTKN